MNLRDYLEKNKISQNKFAISIDYNVGYLRDVIAGRKKLGPKLVRAIERKTEGLVKPHEIQDEGD